LLKTEKLYYGRYFEILYGLLVLQKKTIMNP
jgi:hypothetical protein